MRVFTEQMTALGVSAALHAYIPDESGRTSYAGHRPAVIVFPGGAYRFTFSGEGEPIALAYAGAGICAFVLDYSCAPVRFPVPMLQAFLAVRWVREHAAEYGIDPGNIATTGFSAGGHLCAATGTLWNKFGRWFSEAGMDDADVRVYRPDKLLLCYPVILSHSPYTNVGSFENLLGEAQEDAELLDFLSLEGRVDDETPPVFLWHTSEDDGVYLQNSLAFAAALAGHRIHLEMHVYPHGGHGLCLGTCVTNNCAFSEPHMVSDWIRHAVPFVYDENLGGKTVPEV